PVVDPGVEEARKVLVAQVRRALDARLGAEDDARGGGRPEELLERRLRRVRHLRARLRTEVLDDHLLDVAVAIGQLADRRERLEPLRTRLADPDEDPRGEGDALLAGGRDRLETASRELVR